MKTLCTLAAAALAACSNSEPSQEASAGNVALSNTGRITAEIAAYPALTSWTTAGHAWVCIAHHLNSGIKEDCYGFYPKTQGNEGIIGGSDLANEFKKNPGKFQNVSVSVKKDITLDQYRAFHAVVNDYNSRTWYLVADDCRSFVGAAASSFGWNVPAYTPLPAQWVQRLKAANS